MAKNHEYLKQLQSIIQERHKCSADHRRTVTVHEVVEGKTVWKGEVEIFWLTGHPKAKRCFAWGRLPEDGEAHEPIVTVLEIPPVIGPATAVRTALAAKPTQSA